MRTIGLFPIEIVLFPESIFPLHIYEDRYKELISQSINRDEEFGVNLIFENKMHDIGCTAKVVSVLKKYNDGKLDINIKGLQRYKLNSFSDGEEKWFTGEIEYIFDKEEPRDELLVLEAIKLFNELVGKIKIVNIDEIVYEDLKTEFPSFLIAQKSGLSPIQKQDLLEMHSENHRLEFLKKHLRTVIPVLQEAFQVDKIVKNDGYILPQQF
jgi:Lon protease-like protein